MFVGLFGGTFDPIHNGHIEAANSAHQTLKLDKVIMVPAGDPYLKRTKLVASPKERYCMVSLAIQKIPSFHLCCYSSLLTFDLKQLPGNLERC